MRARSLIDAQGVKCGYAVVGRGMPFLSVLLIVGGYGEGQSYGAEVQDVEAGFSNFMRWGNNDHLFILYLCFYTFFPRSFAQTRKSCHVILLCELTNKTVIIQRVHTP